MSDPQNLNQSSPGALNTGSPPNTQQSLPPASPTPSTAQTNSPPLPVPNTATPGVGAGLGGSGQALQGGSGPALNPGTGGGGTSRTITNTVYVPSIPDMTGQSGKVLSTDGNSAVWVPVNGFGGFSRGDQIVNSSRLTSVVGGAANPILVARSIWVPPDVTRVRVRLANRNSLTGVYYGDINTTLAVGTPTAGLNAWASAPQTQALSTTSTGPAMSQWFNVTPNAAGYVMFAWYMPAAIQYGYEDNVDGFQNTNSTDVVNLPGLVAAGGNPCPLEVAVEYQTKSPRIVILGDSLNRGLAAVAANGAGLNLSLARLGPERGVAACCAALGGQKAANFDPTNVLHSYYDFFSLRGARVLIDLGVNDVLAADTLANLKNYLYFLARDARAALAIEVWLATVSPINQANAVRDGINSFIRTAPFGVDYVFDVDAVIRDPNNVENILPAYDADAPGAHTHWTAPAYEALVQQLVADGKV